MVVPRAERRSFSIPSGCCLLSKEDGKKMMIMVPWPGDGLLEPDWLATRRGETMIDFMAH